MEPLVKAATDFLAAVLSALGFIGRPRRRAGIRDDLDVLAQLRDSPDFGPRSQAYRFLFNHVTREVARFAGVELERKRKIPWHGLAVAILVGAPMGYLTYTLDENGFKWISLLPAGISLVMLLAVLGMLFGDEEAPHDPDARRGEELSAVNGRTQSATAAGEAQAREQVNALTGPSPHRVATESGEGP
jgi:hypothetical protein